MKQRNLFLVGFGIIALGGLGLFIRHQMLWESTDDAYVQAHVLMLSPRIAGTVSQVLVQENQAVKAGQPLVVMDNQDYLTARDQAAADAASLASQDAQALADFQRAQRLFQGGVVTREEFDHAKSKQEALDAALQAAQDKAKQAELNLGYTTLVAPEDGYIAKRAVEPGMVVPAGQPLIGFVTSGERWITANFKETQLEGIRPGRPAEVTVDALPGRTFEGVVDSVSAGTGSTFTLLPPDNATGNFTKVVQRVPVRILLPHLAPSDIPLLQAGLSADVSVRVGG